MQFNLYIFNQLLRTTLALTSVLVGIIWLFQTIRILADRELLVMQSIGLSPLQLAKAPIALGVLLTAFLAVNTVYILPTSFGVYKDQIGRAHV